MAQTAHALAVAAAVVTLCLSGAVRADQEPPAYRLADVDVKPRIIEKRLPFGAPASLFTSPLVVDFVIEPDGTFRNARVSHPATEPHPFTEAYLELLRQWRFAPGRKGGVPVRVAVQLRVEADSPRGAAQGRGGLPLSIPQLATAWTIDGVEDDFAAGVMRMPSPAATGVIWPRVVKEVRPSYSPDAMNAHAVGRVEVEILIGTTGVVEGARIIRSDNQLLDDGALKAAKQWRFEPATSHGKAVPVVVPLVLEFRIAR